MTEDEARDWVRGRYGSAGVTALETIASLVIAESANQNLIAPSTFADIWTRHLVDSAQLLPLADGQEGLWLDIGSGAGFPGLVIAALSDRSVQLVEPRKRRAAFLASATEILALHKRVIVNAARVETLNESAGIISARAVAKVEELFDAASHCASPDALWLLPKGKSAREEVANARRTWHGMFHVEQSITSPDSQIVIARGVARACK